MRRCSRCCRRSRSSRSTASRSSARRPRSRRRTWTRCSRACARSARCSRVVERAAQDGDRVTHGLRGPHRRRGVSRRQGRGLAVTHRRAAHPAGDRAGADRHERRRNRRRSARSFPEDYGATAVAGKRPQFDLKVEKVEERSLPAVDESFAQSLRGAEGGVPELREEVRAQHGARAGRGRAQPRCASSCSMRCIATIRSMCRKACSSSRSASCRRRPCAGSARRTRPQLPAREALEASARRRVALGLLIGEIVRAAGLKVDRARVEQRLEAAIAPRIRIRRRPGGSIWAVARRWSSWNPRRWRIRRSIGR